MLQPRFPGCARKMGGALGWGVLVIVLSAVTCQELDEFTPVEASRIKREGVPENRDLTVLLINDQKRNDYNTKVGRYHSVKPLIGLLTSTARTFIQDGVTTEFATQILGTTLDNGRIYAQVLTKSSLVLYNKPSNVDDAFIVNPTRVHSAFDGQWNVKQDLGVIDPDKFVLKNTDYIAPSSKMEIIYASKPAQENFKFWNAPDTQIDNQIVEEPTARRVQEYNEIPKFEVYNYLDGPAIEAENKFVVQPSVLDINNVNTLHRQSKAYEPFPEPVKIESPAVVDNFNDSNIVKVKPNYDLPTFTIKNEFSPIFYYIDNVESHRSPQQTSQQTKLPKKLFGQKSEPRPKKTFTYAGFADFTTVVGDTVIIFTPNTETIRPQNPDEVNVFPSAKPVDKLASKVTFLSAEIPVATATYKAHEANAATKISSIEEIEVVTENTSGSEEEDLKKAVYNVDDRIPETVSVQYSNGFDFNIDVIQPSEPAFTTTESTRTTEDFEVLPNKEYNSEVTEPLTTLTPSSTLIETSSESAVTESNAGEIFTNSEEETENTAAEVTEKMEEEEEEEQEEEEAPQGDEPEILTTTESGHSEESFEDIETTTENKLEKNEEVICTYGLETQSTMTTEYKTLTYLTTYFLSLENTETSTSIKSDVVIESNVGYLTNIACKTSHIDIEPTSVVTVVTTETERQYMETPEITSEKEPVSPPPTEPTTESPKTTLSLGNRAGEILSPIQEDSVPNTESDTKETIEEEAPTTATTESVSTSHSHVEVTVSTEHPPTESIDSQEDDDENTHENEIDLIYKTLYTTYTYFTTFFGEQTSSIASHKSVVTNIITSTVDLSNLDPSLLGAFNEDDIAPTSVGVGRPTESFAINSIIDLVKNKDVIESVEINDNYNSQTPTPSLGDDIIASIKPDAVKTYFTTYTFFTTIYVGSDANVCSRSEVYTNYVGPDELIPTKSNPLLVENTRAQFDFRNCKQVKREQTEKADENSSVETTVSEGNKDESNNDKIDPTNPAPLEVDMLFSVESNPLSENSYVTDVKSSSSKGETKYIDNNNVLDDQISSESNIDEILPSPTLLLQTSYTTFTYFTTMYIGKDSSKVKSRLETITNVVTETITPKTEPEEENNLPITYYTTFTYWTTLYKDKSTTITSREEIVSNVVTPSVLAIPTVSPIDTTPIDIESVLPPKELEVQLKPSLIEDSLEQDDGKATFYTTYTYFTTFYAGNTSQIRSSLETVTNIVDNTKVVEDNQLGRKVPLGAVDKNLIHDNGDKPYIEPSVIKEAITPTKVPDVSVIGSTVLVGTYIDNLFAEVKPEEGSKTSTDPDKKILFSQVAVISGDSTVVTNDNKSVNDDGSTTTSTTTTTTTEGSVISPTPEVIESSVAEPEVTTEYKLESEEEDDESSPKKPGRLTFTTKKPSFTPVIIPFASRNRPTFSPKRVPLLSSATTITRPDFTPTITATPTLKSVRPSGGFGGARKQAPAPGPSSAGRRFSGRGSGSVIPSGNIPSASRPGGGFIRGSIQPTSRRSGFRSSSLRSNNLDYASRSAVPRIRPTASSRLRGGRQSASILYPPAEQNEFETSATLQDENATEPLEDATEIPSKSTNNPLFRFRRPPVARQPGTAITPRSTTPSNRRNVATRGRLTTTTRRTTTRTTPNPLLSLKRQRPNALFPRRNLFRQPEPEPEQELNENDPKDENEELLDEEEEFEEDNDYDSSDRREQQVPTPATPAPKKNIVQIRPFAFKRRVKRQVDYGNRKYTNFRRPGGKIGSTRRPDPEPETEPPAPPPQKKRPSGRFTTRGNTRTTTDVAPKSPGRQPFIVRGSSSPKTTTTAAPAYRRSKARTSNSRTTTISSRPKAPRLVNKNSQSDRTRTSSARSTGRSRTRTTTSRASSRQRNSFENLSGERFNSFNNILNDGKITITHQLPIEVTIPVVNGKITEYKNVLTAKPSIETLLLNQVSTTVGPLGSQQLVLASESSELGENGVTKVTKFVLHETPTTTVIFTPTTIRGRKTSYSHVLPSTVYNVEPVVQTLAPELNANVPLANLLLSQLLLGNQQPAINPLLALQGQGLLPQQPVVQTPVTEYKTRTTSYVTTVTDARETVLPITFKGKAILTTIVDPTTSVITATEYITDTVVTTPTVLAPQPQFNSLLLPLLLQQQQQQQQLSLQTANPLLGLAQPDLLANNLVPNNNLNNDIYSNSPKPNILSDLNSNEDFADDVADSEEDSPPPPPPPTRGRNRPKPHKPAPPKHTSVVTIYVSGRHPGEFSTVLSTVVTDDTQSVRKREAIYYEDVKILPSLLPTVDELIGSQADNILENSVDTNKSLESSQGDSQIETQSLESIVGSLRDHISYDASPSYIVKLERPSAIRAFNTNGIVYDNTPWRPGRDMDERATSEEDERKLKNLATRIMSNGVEVLVKDKSADGKQEQTKFMEVKTIQPSAHSNIFASNVPKIDKRIDSHEDDIFDMIQPSEVSHAPCTTSSCSCSHTKTEGLKTQYTNFKDPSMAMTDKYNMKTTKYGSSKIDVKPTSKESLNMKTQYHPYDYENISQVAPIDKVVEKYTEVINDYSDEKDVNSVEESELLTNEQAPAPPKNNKVANNKVPDRNKPEKVQKPNKNKFVVAELLKLGSLGIKGLSQLAPVIEKMTGGFIKRQDIEKTTTTTTKPEMELTPYNMNKRVDSDVESKQSNFPIYIPVDELETSESQVSFTNATLHQNIAWAAEFKQPKAHIVLPKIVHESPLVNGGIPISPGEIITANSDVIIGKPAVGGPLTLAASGIKLHNPVNPPPIDSFMANDEQYVVKEKPPRNFQSLVDIKVDDSFDLRPPDLPKMKLKPLRNVPRPGMFFGQQNHGVINQNPSHVPITHSTNDNLMKTEKMKNSNIGNHGRPLFLDYIPSLAKPHNNFPIEHHVDFRPPRVEDSSSEEIADNNPSSSEIIDTRLRTDGEYVLSESVNKPFLVEIQPSRVANVLIPHGSSTALVFAGSSEPHKTGDYVDDPLPYPEPGYFGSFSIDAPQMTNVHNVAPINKNNFIAKPSIQPSTNNYKHTLAPPHKETPIRNDLKIKWNSNKRPIDFNKVPPPTSNQETHVQVGPQITLYNPDNYRGDFDKYNNSPGKINSDGKPKDGKEIIDKEYENYLAVPPPPPPKMHFGQENHYDKNKPYSQRPIIHTKPVQDMKVFLNVQHPIPSVTNKEQLPPKITSEIYFASQMPNSKPTTTYTVQMPHSPSLFTVPNNKPIHTQTYRPTDNHNQYQNSFSVVSSPNFGNKTINNYIDKENTYSVTLNTATNVASNGDPGQVIGSSVAVPIGTTTQNGEINANIPIGTNFAIKVEDDPDKYESYNIIGSRNPSIIYDDHRLSPVKIENNEWNKTVITRNASEFEFNNINTPKKEFSSHNIQNHDVTSKPSIPPSLNSHANFPMINDHVDKTNTLNIKPVTEYVNDIKLGDQRRPAKLIPNIPTNSHGWYSSVLNENNLKNINNIKVDTTTRRIIPLTYDYNKDSIPEFGEKVNNAGKPPAEFWEKTALPVINNNFNIGKPFSKTKETSETISSIQSVRPNYINFDVEQPAYDIPIRDNSDETTTAKPVKSKTDNIKPVYENAEEIYDGSEEVENEGEIDGEVSSESMKVPIVSVSNDRETFTKTTTKAPVIHAEVFTAPKDANKDTKIHLSTHSFNTGTQTEKPFGSYNKTGFQSNSIKPIYEDNSYLKPRPFAVNTLPLDHQLQQPHWQINQMMENATNVSYEENLDLNIGEEMRPSVTSKPPPTPKLPTRFEDKYQKPHRNVIPVYSNNTRIANESNIITSTVHIKDKKPLILEIPEKSTLPTFTITGNSEVNHTSSDIIDLSPPPPTLDYNFKPSTNDETIMGMSPPPPRTPSIGRLPPRAPQTPRPLLPIRTPPPYRTMPPRTLPPRITTQRPVRKPILKDEVSTYRPTYDIINKVKRPGFNRDQPSSQLLPPPMELPSKIIIPIDEIPAPTITSISNVVFPTPVSSGWLTSSGFDFSSSFNFAPPSVYFQKPTESPETPDTFETIYPESSIENSYTNVNVSTERFNYVTTKKPVKQDEPKLNEQVTQTSGTEILPADHNVSDSIQDESSQEETTTDRIKVIPLGNKNRTRKPYPIRNEERKSSTIKYKLPSKITPIIKPTRTISRPDMSSRLASIKKIIRPIPTRTPIIHPTNIIESSESPIDDEFIKPTEVLRESDIPTIIQPESPSIVEKTITSTLTISLEKTSPVVHAVHHSGNEVKISDEIQPTKTEFKTTVVTLTKTLSEPPKTVSSIGYVNLTHTLTVTHTETSLVSKSEGAITETLVLTNTQTSTVVDVVTEIYTQVQPTTIVETVTKHIPIPQVEATPVQEVTTKTIAPLDDISMSSEEADNFIIKDTETTENIQKIETDGENDNDTFFVVMNKSQNGGKSPPITTDIETGDYEGITRNEQVNSNGVSQVLFGEILLAGTPYLETTNVVNPTGVGYGKDCQPDCKASRNERCQRIDGIMKCVCRPGFARMFPDRPCKPTYTYSVKLALGSQGDERLLFHEKLSDNSSKEYHALAVATHEGINRMVMQSDLRDVYHGVHITGFQPVEMKGGNGDKYQGVMNEFYVQLSDNAHESRLKEVIEKYLRNNNFSLGGTDVHAAGELVEKLDVSDFDECTSGQFHDCSEHAQCFNLRGTYTCSCLEGFADLSVNSLYPGRICSAEPVGCERCNYHGSCFSRDDHRVLCECFQWYAGSSCHINLKVVLISLVVLGALLMVVLAVCAVIACSKRPRPPPRSIVACIQGMPSLHQGAMPKQRADRRALISERNESGDASSVQNASLPYMPSKRSSSSKKCVISEPPAHAPPPPPAPAVMIPRARLHPHHSDSRDNLARKRSLELSNEAKLISYLESGAATANDEMRRKHSIESSYSANKDRHNKQGALVSAGFKVSTTIRPDEAMIKDDRDDLSSVNKTDLETEMSRFDTLRKSYSQEDMSEWTDAERRLGELTLSEARSVGGTLPASTGRAASSTRMTSHQEANTMAERDLGSTFLLPHVHLYKPDLTSDVSEFDSL
ncbi:uncharacterized protein [Epargyreus clarus]|uniref:uncharacterized protein n=1 Tax=Epargyreus clarus TaxID=520877 RepID=UPI003C2B290E